MVYEFCPSHYLSAPAVSWDGMFNMTKVKLELISGPDMYIFFEKGMRGGVSYIFNRYKRRNFSLVAHYSLRFTCCSILVAKFARYSLQKFTRYSLQNSLITRCKNSLVTRCKIRSLLVAEVSRCKNSFVVKNHSLLVANSIVTYCINSLRRVS